MEEDSNPPRRKLEPLLGGIALLLLLMGCFVVLRPFLSALMWAIVLAYSLYPLQRLFTRWFRGSRTLAACFVTLTLTLILAGPVTLIGISIAQDGKDLATATRKWFMTTPDVAPAWVQNMPVLGDELTGYWSGFAADRKRWMEQLDQAVDEEPPRAVVVPDSAVGPMAPPLDVAPGTDVKAESSHVVVVIARFLAWARDWLIAVGIAVGRGVTQVLLSAFLAFFLLRDAPVLGERLRVAADRLAGGRGKHLIKVAGDTVRGVIYGILGTAIIQALVAGLGFWIAGVPGAVLLAMLTFFFAVIPFGPPMIWIPASIWLFAQSTTGWGIFMVIWGIFLISSVDNIVRPYLISQGSKMPFVLIFCGVIGGAFAFGLVGVFLGPTLLAVAFRLIEEWSAGPESRGMIAEEDGTSPLLGGLASATPPHVGKSIGVR